MVGPGKGKGKSSTPYALARRPDPLWVDDFPEMDRGDVREKIGKLRRRCGADVWDEMSEAEQQAHFRVLIKLQDYRFSK